MSTPTFDKGHVVTKSSKNRKKLVLLFLLVTYFPFTVQAALVEFEYRATVDFDFGIPGVDVGDQVILKLLADNGSGLRVDPVYRTEDLISGYLTVGDYWQRYEDGWFNSPTDEIFNVFSNLDIVDSDFLGTIESPNHQDSFGTGASIRLLNGTIQDLNDNEAWFDANLVGITSITRWSVTDIPTPLSLHLFAIGLLILLLLQTKRARAGKSFMV